MHGSGASDQRPVGGLIPIKSLPISHSAAPQNAGTHRAQKTYKTPENAKNNTDGACKVIKHVKLALFAQLCYIGVGRNGHDHPTYEILIHSSSSQKAGENRLNQVFPEGNGGISRRFAGAVMAAGLMFAPMGAMANDGASNNETVQTVAVNTIQPASIQNPYLSACDEDDIKDIEEYKNACVDAANGTVVILRNPEEISDIARDIFSKAVHDEYNGQIPLEFRDTVGSTTMFMFDKHGQINERGLVNGSLLYTIGKIYPKKIAPIKVASLELSSN